MYSRLLRRRCNIFAEGGDAGRRRIEILSMVQSAQAHQTCHFSGGAIYTCVGKVAICTIDYR